MPTTTSPLTLASAARLLEEHHLLREIVAGDLWTLDAETLPDAHAPFPAVTYDTRQVAPGSLLFVKGRFRPEFLDGVDDRGLAAYVAEEEHSDRTKAPGLIVDDVQRAMALLSAEFHGRPQDRLTVIGITGTKGKTTTAYFTQAVLNAWNGGRCAMTGSLSTCLDGHTWTPSHLTTPESPDLLRMMRQAADAGMSHFVMEVSSQAYKMGRVFGLTFDVGAFLNIAPDHISAIEHPTFEDYFHCKRRLIANSRTLVLGADSDHADLLRQEAALHGVPVSEFALEADGGTGADGDTGATGADGVTVRADPSWKTGLILTHAGRERALRLDMLGEFNFLNAAAAVSIAMAAGVPFDHPAVAALEDVRVPGRMERFDGGDRLRVYVDFAHNYLSVKALVDEMLRVYGDDDPRITLVAGTTGGKAIDRREGIVKGALGRAESFVFTLDDPNFEDPREICEQMASFVDDPHARVRIITDRGRAIREAVDEARRSAGEGRFNIVLVVGKGHETRNIINGRAVDWPGDAAVVREALSGEGA